VASAEALALLASFVGRSRRTNVGLAIGFVRDEHTPEGPTLARLLPGGRGGEVRLKLLLSMHLIAVAGDHDVTRAPASWARMLDLPGPAGNGARRVRDAIEWLADRQLIRVEPDRVRGPRVYLLSPLGDGQPYTRPNPGEGYINMPVAFWQNGWIVTLSQAALAMWLVVADLEGRHPKASGVWVAPDEARARYRLSEDTFTKGIRELESHHLVEVAKRPLGGEDWYYDRLRNTYRLLRHRLDDLPYSAPSPVPEEPTDKPRAQPSRRRAAVDLTAIEDLLAGFRPPAKPR
jgi:hypothetical protein